MNTLSPIEQASIQYKEWLGKHTFVVEGDLEHKYRKMRSDPAGFIFFRGTFYRWAKLWEKKRKELRDKGLLIGGAPEIFSIGDLHIENFGTWRDGEGRLIWGVNDVDEAYWMRYQNDLVRLATSVLFAIDPHHAPANWKLSPEEFCRLILEGYQEGLQKGGKPFILERHHPWLWKIATHPSRTPEQFASALEQKIKLVKHSMPEDILDRATRALDELAPKKTKGSELYRRRAGVGSLGRPRLLRFFSGTCGIVLRETKAVIPSACVFLGQGKAIRNAYGKILDSAVRVQDPIFGVFGRWVVRRLAFDSSRVEVESLKTLQEASGFFHAMGFEIANLHLSDPEASAILPHLRKQNRKNPHWLLKAAGEMYKLTKSDFADYLETGFGHETEETAKPAPRKKKK